ncbi:MAG TPA: Do family serine endopeptidase [Gemmatimonadaceae bacterium]|nr:Do family serine endopeptidase [Gemmatimonadaceae bacterium]
MGAVAFIAGIFFASSMDWTRIVGAQSRVPGRTALVSNAALDESQSAFVSVAERVTPAVVSVSAEHTVKPQDMRNRFRNMPPEMQKFFEDQQQPSGPQVAQGSGFIVTKDGYILTNNHVVDGADEVKVAMLDHRSYKAKVVGHDIQTDVAVLKIDAGELPTVPLGDDAKTRVGEWALAIGNPFGLDFTVTAGIISAKGRSQQLRDLNRNDYAIQDFIQTDAAINPGNSGGPLVNIRGEVVGINSAIASETGSYTGYGFAIPITLAKTVMDDIIAHGHVRRAILGAAINEVTAEDAAVNHLKDIVGVRVESFLEGSPAEKAGMEPGDVVTKIDGQPTDRLSTLQRLIRSHQPGDVVTLDALRYGEHKTFKVKLIEAPGDNVVASAGDKPARNTTPAVPTSTTNAKQLGIVLEPVTADLIKRTGSDIATPTGVAVKSVEHGGAADNKLIQGDIITAVIFPAPRTQVKSADDLQRVLSKMKAGDYIGLSVSNFNAKGALQSRIVNIRMGGN